MYRHEFVYYNKVTSFPEEWIDAHLNILTNVCFVLFRRQDKDYEAIDVDMIDFFSSVDSRQTFIVTNETSNSVKLTRHRPV